MTGSTGSYERDVDTLERELGIIEDSFRGLSDEDWSSRTHLQPIDPELPRWTLLELATHFDISIGLTRALIAEPQDGQPGRDRVSFIIFSRNEVAPVVYDYAVRGAEGRTLASMPCRSTPEAISTTASILDELLARRTVAGRPADLAGDDLAWIRAASGRQQHPDPRLPLIG